MIPYLCNETLMDGILFESCLLMSGEGLFGQHDGATRVQQVNKSSPEGTHLQAAGRVDQVALPTSGAKQ